MGNFLNCLKQNARQPPKNYQLLKKALSKLREYHGSFKSICDTFAIDPKDFENIFGNNENFSAKYHFELWDTDKNQLIDALELFAGLIMFSGDSFNEKVRFLFDIFDFNELNSLSVIDLEFMLISCCNATFKIFQMESDINEDNISEFLSANFKEDQRINISQMISWCTSKQEIIEYCELIKVKKPLENNKKDAQGNSIDQEQLKPVNEIKSLPMILNSKKYQQKIDWLSAISKKLKFLNQSHFQTAGRDVIIKPKWVYGFRSQGVKKPLAYLKQNNAKKIFYFTANIVVIFYPELNKQEHYLEHDREVISLAIAKNSGLIASGELGDQAAIHVWNSTNLQNIGVIQGIHQKGVNFITFFKNDEFIATCGIRPQSPILIYNIRNLQLVLSTFVEGNAIQVLTVNNFIGSFDQKYQNNKKYNVYNQNNYQQLQDSTVSENYQKNVIDEEELFDNYENSFFIFTKSEIILFFFNKGRFQQQIINLKDMVDYESGQVNFQIKGELTCAQVIRINTENPYLKAYTEDGKGAVQIILGTDQGYLYYFNWPNFESIQEFKYPQNYKTSIVNIATYQHGLIVASGDSTLHLWDFTFSYNIKNIDLTNFSFKLFNYDIADILVVETVLMVSTTDGDIIEIDMNQKQEWTSNKFIQKLNAVRINYITKFSGELQAMCLIERAENDDKILFVAGSSTIVYGFSLETHEIVDVWTIGGDQPITCMDCVNFEDGGTVFVIGCAGTPSKLIMRIDWEEQPRTLEIPETVHDVKFSSDTYYLIACCNDGCVYLYMHNQNHYFNVLPKKIQFDNEIPISIDFVDDNKSFLIGTSVRNQYKIELPDLKNKIILQENEKINSTMWKLRYPLHTKNFQQNMLPIIIGGDIKVFLAAGESGFLYFWKDHEQLESNCGGFLKGHASQISRILMTQSQDVFFTVGQKDNTVIEWSVDFINEFNDFSKPFPINPQNVLSQQQQGEKQIIIKDEVLVRELAYSYQGKNDFICDTFKDQFLLFRGTNQKTLNQHLYDLLSQDYGVEESNLLRKRPPPLSIELDFVYGFAAFDKRNTLHYVHLYHEEVTITKDKKKKFIQKEQERKDLIKKLSKHKQILEYQNDQCVELSIQSGEYQQNNQLPNDKVYQKNLQYEEYHTNCSRNFVYFVSRIAIVYNPLTNKQKFYQGHKNKITCLAIHPLKFYVASGEASSKPSIHIWNVLNCEAYKILPTYHKNGIISLAFSNDATFIVSSGIDISFSIQVTNWQTEQVVAFRNTGQYHIFDLRFNPFNRYEFVTCGSQNLTIWNLNGRNLLRNYVINVAEQSVHGSNCCITCIQYISFQITNQEKCDIICGNNMGDICLVTCGKYLVAKEGAHSKMINCLKVTEAFRNTVVIITAGQDDQIKFWDTKFNQINVIQVSTMKNPSQSGFFSHYQESRQELKNKQDQKNCSAQSLDVFICVKDQKPVETKHMEEKKKKKHKDFLKYKSWPKILIGTRNGDIIEATFILDLSFYEKKKNREDKKNLNLVKPKGAIYNEDSSESSEEEDEQELLLQMYGQASKGFKFDYSLFLRSHSSQIFKEQNVSKKIYFSLHPNQPILVTVGEDQNMCVFDIANNKLLSIEYLSKTPSAIKFSPDGDLLVIGLTSGDLVIYDSKFKKSNYGKPGDKYDLPQFSKSLVQWIKVKDRVESAILNIEFSQRGEMLAVSYDNARQQKELEGKYEKEGSYITIYSNRASHKNSKPRGQEKLIYTQYIDIRCPSTYDTYKTDSNVYGCAAHYMTFSQEQDKEYLLIYYQLIDNYLVRVNHDSQGTYLIWDLTNNSAVKQWDSIKNIQWKCFNFPNSMISQYQYCPNLLITDDKDKEQQQQSQNQAPPFQSVMLDLRTWENNKYQYLATGSIRGDIHFIKNTCLSGDKDFVTENIQKEKMFLGKSYAARISFVNQIEASQSHQQYLFSSGITDQCVFKWKFIQEEQLWDLDYLEYKLDQPDVFSELVKKDKFTNLYSEVLTLRKQTTDIKQNVEETRQSPVELKLQNIIGRNAYTKLNNLFYDYEDNIVYIAGCNLVITNPREEDIDLRHYNQDDSSEEEEYSLQQKIIKLDDTPNSSFPELSCFSLSADKKFLVAGTVQLHGKILIWDICSRTCIKTFALKNVPIILLVKFAYDNRHICAVTLTNEYTMKVYLIDSLYPTVLGSANFPYSLPFKIKDIHFFPDSIYKFVTCGVQHMTVWQLNGGILSYQSLEIENPKEIEDQKKNNQQEFDKQEEINQYDENNEEVKENEEEEISKENLRVIFLCLTFVYDIIITGGEDGYLYIWEDKQIKQKHLTQKKIIIMALNSLKNTNLFVSGSMNGVVNLWSIVRGEYYFVIERIQEYNISKEDSIESIKNPCNIIQSLCIGSKYILVGTKSGDIYELLRPTEKDKETKEITQKNYQQTQEENQNNVKLRLSCNDDDIPQAIAFNQYSDCLYTITARGLFSVWDIKTLQRRYIKSFATETHGLIVCKKSDKIIIAFDSEIQILNQINQKNQQTQQEVLSFSIVHKIPLDSTITDIKMSHTENLLAVALNPNKDNSAKIEIYDASRDDGNFKILCQVGNLPTSIEYLDFTMDNHYLMYKDNFEEVSIIDLKNLKKINTLFVEYDAKWQSDGIKVSEKTKGIYNYYNDENKIHHIVTIGENSIAVTDEMGTIRIFDYPSESSSGHGYLKCYTDHLNYINCCVLSPDKKYLVTSSSNDRCIVIWKVQLNKIKQNINIDEDDEGEEDDDEGEEDQDQNNKSENQGNNISDNKENDI